MPRAYPGWGNSSAQGPGLAGGLGGAAAAVGEQHEVEDHEPHQEREAVGGKVDALQEHGPAEAVHVWVRRDRVGEGGRLGGGGAGDRGDSPDREGLTDEVLAARYA